MSLWSEKCPLYPQKQTLDDGVGMSALGHKRTLATKQSLSLAAMRLRAQRACLGRWCIPFEEQLVADILANCTKRSKNSCLEILSLRPAPASNGHLPAFCGFRPLSSNGRRASPSLAQLCSVFLEFGCIGDDVLSNQVRWHW